MHFESSKLLPVLTFVDLNNLFDKDGNYGVGFSIFDASTPQPFNSQGAIGSPMLMLPSQLSFMRNVVESLKAMFQM
jgi:hypothetical protein